MAAEPPVEPYYRVSRRGWLIYSIAVSVAICLAIGGGVVMFLKLNELTKDNHTSIRRLDRLTHPTPAQFREDLKNGIKRCLAEAECRRLFPGIRRDRRGRISAAPSGSLNRSSPSLARRTGEGTSTLGAPVSHRRSGRSPVATGPDRVAKRPRQPGSGSSSPAPSSGSPPPPPAPVEVHLPAPLRLCTDLARLNCS
jgi:hypothetical protein